MRLLICTQAVDKNDPILGFFHRWIEILSKSFGATHVICLKKGVYDLPGVVRVHSLGKEMRRSRIQYMWRLYVHVWRLRNEYDAVFVHMNEEYVLLCGLIWRFLGKRVFLWRNHAKGSWRTDMACRLSNVVLYTSPSAYVARYSKACQMPIGIDTEIFTPASNHTQSNAILFFGRLDAVKNPHVFLEAMQKMEGTVPKVNAHVYGDSTPGREWYRDALRSKYSTLSNVHFHPAIAPADAPSIFRTYGVYVNLTPSGSFDKTIGEAMASGCVVVAANDAVQDILAPGCFVSKINADSVCTAISLSLNMSAQERARTVARQRSFIEQEHSLALLTRRLSTIISQ